MIIYPKRIAHKHWSLCRQCLCLDDAIQWRNRLDKTWTMTCRLWHLDLWLLFAMIYPYHIYIYLHSIILIIHIIYIYILYIVYVYHSMIRSSCWILSWYSDDILKLRGSRPGRRRGRRPAPWRCRRVGANAPAAPAAQQTRSADQLIGEGPGQESPGITGQWPKCSVNVVRCSVKKQEWPEWPELR